MEYRLVDFGDSISVVSFTITPESACGHAAQVIQNAIDRCADNGGGTVYLEAGEYVLTEPVTVKTAVILCGCSNPVRETDKKTILLCHAGMNDPDGAAQITLAACSGLRNLVMYYPEQSLENPVPCSPAVRQNGVDSITLESIVMVNPWRGIQCGPDANELHFIKNVYLTPLDIGFYIDMTTDIGRIQGLHVTPDCYADYTGTDIDTVRDYMLTHTTGLFMARSDWEYVYDFSAEFCRTGILITAVKDSGPNAQISGVRLHNCVTGIRLVDVNPYGIALSDSVISADREDLDTAVRTESGFGTIMQLNGVDFENINGYRTIVIHTGSGQLSFADCTFHGWSADDSAVICQNGGISFIQCAFEGSGADFSFSDTISGAQILGCSFAHTHPTVLYNHVSADAAELDFVRYTPDSPGLPKASRGGFKPYPWPVGPAQKKLFCAEDFGAVRNTDKDASPAIQAAINAAEEAGGGIVYLPGGRYLCNSPLHVSSGVELRGVAEVPCHTMGGGSVLMTCWAEGMKTQIPL